MSDRRFVSTAVAAAALTLAFAALVFAGTFGEVPPAPPAPPARPVALAAAPAPPAAVPPALAGPAVPALPATPAALAPPALPAVPAVAPLPPIPPPALRGRIHTGDHSVRISGETLVVESDGDAWVIDDPATVRQFRDSVRDIERQAREMAKAVERIQPALAAAKRFEVDFDESAFRDMEKALEAVVERDVDREVRRALAQAETAGARAQESLKRHEESLRRMERQLEKFEKEMEALERTMDRSGKDLDVDLDEIIDEAFEKGLAKPKQ